MMFATKHLVFATVAAIAIGLASVASLAAAEVVGLCFPSSNGCSNNVTQTISGNPHGGATIDSCKSVRVKYDVKSVCTSSDCKTGCSSASTKASQCLPTEGVKCIVFA